MVPKFWATNDQLVFLRSQLNMFFERQKHQQLDKFWQEVNRDWFTQWLEPGITDDISPELAGAALQAWKQVSQKSIIESS